MLELIEKYWWVVWGIAGPIGFLKWQSRQKGGNESVGASLRKNINRHTDPQSPSCDPGLFEGQLIILLFGFPLIAVTLLVVWLLDY